MTTVFTRVEAGVGVITISRPEALNAIDQSTMDALLSATATFDSDPEIGAIVVTGEERAFVAGADIRQMAAKSFGQMLEDDIEAKWHRFASTRKPMIAAVNGYALGGGCEIALMCDIIIASEKARFGLPEIKLGVIPGWGGTQRLTRAVGKARAMELVLTGRVIDANEGERIGLVSRVVAHDALMVEALAMGTAIAAFSREAVLLAKQAINRAFEVGLAEGVHFERQAFYSLFATENQKEGMNAFLAKRAPSFKNR